MNRPSPFVREYVLKRLHEERAERARRESVVAPFEARLAELERRVLELEAREPIAVRILSALDVEGSSGTVPELARRFGASYHAAKRAMDRLQKRGIVRVVGMDRVGRRRVHRWARVRA